MNSLTKKIYLNSILILYLCCALFGIYYYLTSECDVVEWFFSSKYLSIYANSIFFLFTIKRVHLFQSLYIGMKIRLNDEGYTLFLIKSLFIHLGVYMIFLYAPFAMAIIQTQLWYYLFLYFGIIITMQFVCELIIMWILEKQLPAYYLALNVMIYVLIQFLVIGMIL